METNRETEDPVDERRFARVPYRGQVQFECGAGSKGSALAGDVGRGGMRVRMGRYLRPGTKLMITISLAGSKKKTIELKSEVVWCRRGPGQLEFDAGIRVYYDAPEALEAISEVMYDALFEQGGLKKRDVRMVAQRSMSIHGLEIASQTLKTACGFIA